MHDTVENEDRAGADSKWLRPELIAPWWEIVLVLCVMLGPFAYSSARQAHHGADISAIEKILTTPGLLRNTAEEAGLLAAFFFYLRWRGWRPADFQIRIDPVGTLLAVPLCVVATLANMIIATGVMLLVVVIAPHPHGLVAAMLAGSPHMRPHHIDLAWTIIVVGSVVNAYLEELTFMGYGFHQFAAKRNPLFALLVMVFLRMLLHTYKGPAGMLGIGAFSFVYGATYLKVRRLWPLILAHIVTDVFAFTLFKLLFGH